MSSQSNPKRDTSHTKYKANNGDGHSTTTTTTSLAATITSTTTTTTMLSLRPVRTEDERGESVTWWEKRDNDNDNDGGDRCRRRLLEAEAGSAEV